MIATIAAETAGALVLSALVVTIIISTAIPIITGLLTKATLPSWIKGVMTIILNAVNALVVNATLADGTAVISQETFVVWVLGVVTSIAIYAGVYKPAHITSSGDGKLKPESGIGPETLKLKKAA